jgi:predicted RNA-binding protein (virulence factor B family)
VIEIGKYNELTILRYTSVGLYLGDDNGEDVLLPNKYCPKDFKVGEKLTVFVYLDFAERKVATNLIPGIQLHEFALLKVTDVADVGAFLDWGLEKDLMVPYREQRQKMEMGRWYVVYLDIDKETNRLYASNKINKFLSNELLTVKEGDMVNILVAQKTDLGYSVIVNNRHKGLVYQGEFFQKLNIGDVLNGYIKKIREDHKLDISLQPIGYDHYNDANAEKILQKLKAQAGFLTTTDKSPPEEIYAQFGMSKKAFKKAIGALYKKRKIIFESGGIKAI